MALEIERKFLVHHDLLPGLTDGERMIQGYLSKKPSVRFRIIGEMMVMTVKEYISRGKRFELETPAKKITIEEIEKLQFLAICPPIIKVRYKIHGEQGLIWELDVYQEENNGLITVDIELPDIETPIIFPVWVDKNQEITGDPRYSNFNLGSVPFSSWI